MSINGTGNLKGLISYEGTLKGSISYEGNLKGSLSVFVGCQPYTGTYEIIPEINEQILPTFDKHMIKDVTIKEIPIYKVDNDQDGQTVIIGG